MPQNETDEDIDETEEGDEQEGDDAEQGPEVPDPVETLATLNEELKAHHVRLGTTIPQLLAQLNGDSPEHALLRALALELSETVIGLLADVADATTEALIQFREWADNEIEPWLEELDEDVGAAGESGIEEGEAVLPVAVVQSTSTNLGALRTMIEGAIAQATSPEQQAQLAAMREEVDKNIAALAEALSEPDEPEAEAAAAPAS